MQDINKDIYINCCPVCGSEINTQFSFSLHECFDCKSYRQTTKQERKEKDILNKKVPLEYISQHPKAHYEKLSTERYGDASHWKEIFVAEELSQNPQFNHCEFLNSCERQKQRDARRKELLRQQELQKNNPTSTQPSQPNKPHCPTCNSTSIKKISDIRRGVHGAMWGLLSNTARSQFECKNCGYKW